MTQTDPLEDLKRIIILLYGVMENGGPCWVFAAIRPSKYQQFTAKQKEGDIDLEKFNYYGELIVSGEGKSPPDDVILKVAEMYQTDPASFAQNVAEDAKNQA